MPSSTPARGGTSHDLRTRLSEVERKLQDCSYPQSVCRVLAGQRAERYSWPQGSTGSSTELLTGRKGLCTATVTLSTRPVDNELAQRDAAAHHQCAGPETEAGPKGRRRMNGGDTVAKKYLFADESGNFDFRDHMGNQGISKYFSVGTVMIEGDEALAALEADMLKLKRELAWNNVVHDDAFHATEDPQAVRDAVFDLLKGHAFHVDVTLLEKSKSMPKLRIDEPTFYKYAWWFHFKYLAPNYIKEGDELMVVAASLGTRKKRAAFKGAVEDVVRQCTNYKVPRQVAFWPVEAQPALQVADYSVWAVSRYWERGDDRARQQLGTRLRTEWDYFKWGSVHYYGSKAPGSQSA